MFFEEVVNFRLQTKVYKEISNIVKKDSDRYDNQSHFIRVAILKLVREEKKRLNMKV